MSKKFKGELNLIKIIDDLNANPNNAWDIPIVSKFNKTEYYAMVSLQYLSECSGVSVTTLSRAKKFKTPQLPLLNKINKIMVDQGVIIKGERASVLKHRVRCIKWWRSLTQDEKYNLEVFNNSIRFGRYIRGWKHATHHEIIKEFARKCNKELEEMDVLVCETFKGEKNLLKLINTLKEDPAKAWDIPIVKKNNRTEYYAMVSYNYLRDCIGISVITISSAERLNSPQLPLLNKINEIMIQQGVILKGETASTLNLRVRCIKWWSSLTPEEKRNLLTHGNSIRFAFYIKGWKKGARQTIIKNLAKKYNQELREMGVLSNNYLLFNDRRALLDKSYQSNLRLGVTRWEELSRKKLDSVEDLIDPESSDEPYIQLKQLAACQINANASRSNKKNTKISFKHLCKYLINNRVNEKAQLKDILDEFILYSFKHEYLLPLVEKRLIASSTAVTYLSKIRTILDRATVIKGLGFNKYLDVVLQLSGRSTEAYKPYSKKEREKIDASIKSEIKAVKKMLKHYVKKDIGVYPLNKDFHIIKGMATVDNARYLFENHLNCQPIFYKGKLSPIEKAFLRIININKIKLHSLYKDWGFLPVYDLDILAPFIFRVAQITGMNADSITNLKLDSLLLEHPVTGKACIRYWKERSKGGKELHLDIFSASIQWLTKKQSQEVLDIFDTVKTITSHFREEAPLEIKDYLFIYKSSGTKFYNEVMSFLGQKKLSSSYSSFVKRNDLVGEDGNPLRFTITRFRPTFVSELVESGISIREIQLSLGHSNIQTTMSYLDRMDFNRMARLKIKDILVKVHTKVILKTNEVKTKSYLSNNKRVIFSTPLGGCLNIFSPPDFIKNSPIYRKGQPCSQYNKCLSCENVMITVEHLPMLFAMRRDYMINLQRNRVMDTPYGLVIEENLLLLDEILNPKKSEFSLMDLEKGERLSTFEETALIDSVTA